jgi:hypothetical protein
MAKSYKTIIIIIIAVGLFSASISADYDSVFFEMEFDGPLLEMDPASLIFPNHHRNFSYGLNSNAYREYFDTSLTLGCDDYGWKMY